MRNDLGLYLHIPFCMKKCGYCDFLSWKGTREEQENYVQSLIREIESYEAFAKGYKVSTVFLGGGTPSILSGEQMERILGAVSKVFWLEKRPEITVEMNPGTVTEEKLKSYKRAGVNRLSIGLQSVKNENLRLLGRIHTYEEFLHTYELARQEGFDNISIDLISSIPGQTLEAWEEELRQVISLKPEHISVYQLILEEGTPFYEKYAEHPECLPGEEASRDIYLLTGKLLKEAGYEQYEISNYAKPGYESRHNLKYWERKDYLGLGPGAASMVRNIRMSNTRDMKIYLERCGQPKTMREEVEFLEEPRQMEEFMFLGLRMMQGIRGEEFFHCFGAAIESIYGFVLEQLMQQDLIKKSGSTYFLSEAGIDVSNYVLAQFLL